MKAKEWLLEKGYISAITRGRISRDNHAHIAKAIENGLVLSDYKQVIGVTGPKTTVSVERTDPDAIVELRPYHYPENEYRLFEWRDGKKFTRSLREACSNCGYSVVGCYCDDIRIVKTDGSGSVAVFVERI